MSQNKVELDHIKDTVQKRDEERQRKREEEQRKKREEDELFEEL